MQTPQLATPQRVTLNTWLRAITSQRGPKTARLRHAALTLATFIRGNGSQGCFPGHRALGTAMAVAHTTAARALHALEAQGWLATELAKRQYGTTGKRYYPAVPKHLSDAQASQTDKKTPADNGTPSALQSADTLNGAPSALHCTETEIGANSQIIGAPSALQKSLTEVSKSSAATPSPAKAGYAALTDTERDILGTARLGYTAEQIAKLLTTRHHLSITDVQATLALHHKKQQR